MTATVLQRPITDPASAVATSGPAVATAGSAAPAARHRLHRRWKVALLLLGGAAMVYTLHGRMPAWADMGTALTTADSHWLLAAAAAQVVSLGMFALQQQRLLRALGVAIGFGRLNAVSYARSALAIALPGGSVISAAFALKQYRARGAGHHVAATAMILSGLVSAGALLLLASSWTALYSPAGGYRTIGYLIGAGALVAAVLAAARLRAGARAGLAVLAGRLAARWPMVATATTSVARAGRAVATMRRRDVLYAVVFALLNWLSDLLCLVAAVRAVGIDLPVLTLAGAYLTVQVVRQIPITPGGIGVVEASLLMALATAGAANAPAAAAVLIYRILSCWLIIPIGRAFWTALQAPAEPSTPTGPRDDAAAARPAAISV
jgi:uncharacterized membrane protein YbhN (UPF0104 family)